MQQHVTEPRARWAANYREFRKADALWSRFFKRLRPHGVPSFVQASPSGNCCRLIGDGLQWRTGKGLSHEARMTHLRNLSVRLP